MKPAVKAYNWVYHRTYRGAKNFVDPRMAIAWQINWARPISREWTENPTPEPDNYNWAIATRQAVECKLVKNQVIYYDQTRKIWLTVMFVERRIELVAIKSWARSIDILAYWQHLSAPMLRQRRHLLWNRQRAVDMTVEENLYMQGYYENLKSKYFCDEKHTEFFNTRIGEARATLTKPNTLDEDLVPNPEDLEYDT